MEIGQEGTINWSDGTTSRVILVDIEYNSYTQNDYWLEYSSLAGTRERVVRGCFGPRDHLRL
jgi:hypothetical protein